MIETTTQTPISPEKLLCLMTDVFMEVKAEKDIKSQLKLFPMMSRLSVYLHTKKHKNGHYMKSPEAIQTLTAEECMEMMQSIMSVGMEEESPELVKKSKKPQPSYAKAPKHNSPYSKTSRNNFSYPQSLNSSPTSFHQLGSSDRQKEQKYQMVEKNLIFRP